MRTLTLRDRRNRLRVASNRRLNSVLLNVDRRKNRKRMPAVEGMRTLQCQGKNGRRAEMQARLASIPVFEHLPKTSQYPNSKPIVFQPLEAIKPCLCDIAFICIFELFEQLQRLIGDVRLECPGEIEFHDANTGIVWLARFKLRERVPVQVDRLFDVTLDSQRGGSPLCRSDAICRTFGAEGRRNLLGTSEVLCRPAEIAGLVQHFSQNQVERGCQRA